jgi:hypothetical protein
MIGSTATVSGAKETFVSDFSGHVRPTLAERPGHTSPGPSGVPGPRLPRRFLLLLGLALLYYVINKHPQYQPQEHELSAPVPLLPIPIVVWHTIGWLIFGTGLWTLFASRAEWAPSADDVPLRRSALATLALAFAIELVARLSGVGFFGLEQRVGWAGLLVPGTLGLLALAALLRWPPATPVLTLLMLAGGLGVRLSWLALVPPDPKHSDNMFVIRGGFERLVAGQTPYAYFDFGTHTNPMPYLPWTFLSYLPPFLARLDLRVTSIVLSLALVLLLWALFRALPMSPTVRNGLVLVLGVLYALPLSISLDVQTEFPMFNLMLVLTFALIALRRLHPAAVVYGVALGAMPVALYTVAPLLCFTVRGRPWRQAASLVAIVLVVAGVPVLAFLFWDPHAFLWAVSYVPREAWKSLDNGHWDTPFTPIVWHRLGGWLRAVQVAWFLVFATLAWQRLRTVHGLIALAAGSHLALVLSGPYVGPHLVQVVLFLAVLGEAVRAAEVESLPRSA